MSRRLLAARWPTAIGPPQSAAARLNGFVFGAAAGRALDIRAAESFADLGRAGARITLEEAARAQLKKLAFAHASGLRGGRLSEWVVLQLVRKRIASEHFFFFNFFNMLARQRAR